MCSKYFMSVAFILAKLLLTSTFLSVQCSYSSETASTHTLSTSGDSLTSSRHKRAPGLGKRTSLNEELFDQSGGDSLAILRPDVYLPERTQSTEKRAPGWGKRAPGWGKRAPGWGKRAPGWGKRAPGWGKRSYFEDRLSNSKPALNDNIPDLNGEDFDNQGDYEFLDIGKRAPGWGKRAPGWGKRAPGWGKRAPGWGKRAPGWGKRSYLVELDSEDSDTAKRSDDWDSKQDIEQEQFENIELSNEDGESNRELNPSKISTNDDLPLERRAPGWGKRNYQLGLSHEDIQTIKRSPGWGKRAPGWGKRAPGWGKRTYDVGDEDGDVDKRAPGWGKRSIRRVRRMARSVKSPAQACQEVRNLKDYYSAKLKTAVPNSQDLP